MKRTVVIVVFVQGNELFPSSFLLGSILHTIDLNHPSWKKIILNGVGVFKSGEAMPNNFLEDRKPF